MTTRRPKQISEPVLPEHQLIRDSIPMPELSAGFKSRVMAECSVSMASAARAWRWKVGTTTAVVCALSLLVCLAWFSADDDSQTVIRQVDDLKPATQQQYQLPASAATKLAVDNPKPSTQQKKSSATGNGLIDGLNQRQQLFDANMLPF